MFSPEDVKCTFCNSRAAYCVMPEAIAMNYESCLDPKCLQRAVNLCLKYDKAGSGYTEYDPKDRCVHITPFYEDFYVSSE